MILSASCFPLNRYHCIKPAATFTHGASLLVAFTIAVLLPVIAVALAIAAHVATAQKALSHAPSWTHQPWGNFYCSFFLAHIQSTILFPSIVICFIFLPIAIAK